MIFLKELFDKAIHIAIKGAIDYVKDRHEPDAIIDSITVNFKWESMKINLRFPNACYENESVGITIYNNTLMLTSNNAHEELVLTSEQLRDFTDYYLVRSLHAHEKYIIEEAITKGSVEDYVFKYGLSCAKKAKHKFDSILATYEDMKENAHMHEENDKLPF